MQVRNSYYFFTASCVNSSPGHSISDYWGSNQVSITRPVCPSSSCVLATEISQPPLSPEKDPLAPHQLVTSLPEQPAVNADMGVQKAAPSSSGAHNNFVV